MQGGNRMRQKVGKLYNLCISLLLLMLLYPVLERTVARRAVLNLVTAIVLISAVSGVRETRRSFVIHMVLAGLYLIGTWIRLFVSEFQLPIIVPIFSILFYGYTIVIILRYVIRAKRVTLKVLSGAIAVYLLLGQFWAGMYLLEEGMHPGSFALPGGAQAHRAILTSEIVYFSYVTLTTLGFGDITPVTTAARSTATIEAITGVLFTATIIARLVGIYISQTLVCKEEP
jgi:hypothetical protein